VLLTFLTHDSQDITPKTYVSHWLYVHTLATSSYTRLVSTQIQYLPASRQHWRSRSSAICKPWSTAGSTDQDGNLRKPCFRTCRSIYLERSPEHFQMQYKLSSIFRCYLKHFNFYFSFYQHTERVRIFFYARKQNASRVFAIVWASVCPSVTLVSCIKTVQARITKSLLWAAPRSLVYRGKISCHWVQGFPSNEGVEEGYPP